MHDLRNTCRLLTISTQREFLGSYQIQGQWLDVSVHFNTTHTLIELTPTVRQPIGIGIKKQSGPGAHL